jgi:3-dehydroquinate synthase
LIDTLFLESLPKKEFRNGIAEIIKYAVVFNKPELNRFEFKVSIKDEDFEKLIIKSCEVKVGIVEKDVNDKGLRHVLNFGHTIGHAIELLAGLSHGEAISIGIIKELELGVQEGLVNREKLEKVRKCLGKNNLPIEFPANIDKEKVLELMKKDKKGGLVFAFDENNYNVRIDEEKVKKFLGI